MISTTKHCSVIPQILMNVMKACVPMETAETHQDRSHVLVMKDTFSVGMSVKVSVII